MSRTSTLQLINVSQFNEAIFRPALMMVERRSVGLSYDLALSNILETIWWLQLGVELEYFSETNANQLLRGVNHQTIDAFVGRRRAHFSDPLLQSALLMVERHTVLPLEESWFFRSPETLRVPFQSFLLITSTLGADPLANWVFKFCNFSTEDDWRNLMALTPNAGEVYRAFAGTISSNDLVGRRQDGITVSFEPSAQLVAGEPYLARIRSLLLSWQARGDSQTGRTH
jgi:hypothetical protein